jgi:hypothetical protein
MSLRQEIDFSYEVKISFVLWMIFLFNIKTKTYWIYLDQPELTCETHKDNLAQNKLETQSPINSMLNMKLVKKKHLIKKIDEHESISQIQNASHAIHQIH